MDELASKIKQRVNTRLKKLSRRTPNDPEPSTASRDEQRTKGPAISATSPLPASKKINPPHPSSTVSALHPEPNEVMQRPVEPTGPPSTKQVAAPDDWLGLKQFTRVIDKLSEPFGPLKQAVDGILEVVETSELAARNRDDFRKLKAELNTLFNDLAGYFGSSTPPTMTPSIVNLAKGIERELVIIRQNQPRDGVKGYVSAEVDADHILEHYRSLEALFRRLTLNTNMDIMKAINELAMDNRLSRLPNSQDAKYRSAKSSFVLRGECTPNTRVKVLADLHEWALDSKSPRIYWLNGMAGTGKTTIAYSFCRNLEDSHRLAASFFCSRQLKGCHDVDRIVPTISYQLSQFSLPFRTAVSQAIEKDSDIHNQLVLDQFRQLIDEPLVKSKDALPTDLVIVVDALDECEGCRGTEFLMALFSHAWDLPVKFFVTSRPDAGILDLMRIQKGEQTPTELRLHELDQSIVTEDIRTYLHTKIASPKIRISASDLDTLVKRSGILFIYAATVARYIEYDNFSRAEKRLKEVLDSTNSGSQSNSGKVINALYTAILVAALKDPDLNESDQDEAKQILHTVICAQEPLSIDTIAGILGLGKETVQAALRPLLSVLQVSDTTGVITTLHESFPDYLLDKTRSGEFHCDAREHNACLTRICFDQINKPDPAFNICKLESSYVFDTEVSDLPTRIGKAISKELGYACHYWGAHIMLAKDSEELARMLLRFLSERFLLWLEVVNLCEYIYDGVRTLHQMQRWASTCGWLDENVKRPLRDAWMFTASFSSSPARLCTPHIYVSALTFWPDHSLMSQFYKQEGSKVIASESTAMQLRSVIPLSVQNTRSEIENLAYSPDGAHIVSGSWDNTVCIWDAHTGQPIGQPLEGHTNSVSSAAYSPDGAYIVSGSWDDTIRIWDARTRQPVGEPLKGHTKPVTSVVYSPDGAYIVSSSRDRTIRIWDASTRQLVGQPLTGHTSDVWSVAYSPDSAYIVSGSYDNTIRIWDARTRQLVGQPLEGHTSRILSVVYSPDGANIVSGSLDRTIRIWNARTRQPVGQPLGGHTSSVCSVSYSPDGAYILSSSTDNTIRIWDAHTRQPVGQPLEGHTRTATSVTYSPDGAYIVSGSYDHTIRTWDARTAHQTAGQPLEGHTSGVTSIAYSASGAYIASGSLDNTIRVWDASTCQPVGQPLQGHTNHVWSVACSPDSAYIVSGSYDNTIRIWDARTRQLAEQPLEGHTSFILSVGYSPDGAYIVSGSHDKTVRIWDVRTSQPVGQPLEGHTRAITSVAFSPDGAYIVSGSYDSAIRTWDARTSQPVGQPLEGHTMAVTSVGYSPDGAYIVSGSHDKTVRIWDVRTSQPVGQPLEGHTSDVRSVAYSPDGAFIVSGSDDKTVRIWDARTRQPVGQPLEGHTNNVTAVAYSPDGTYITSASADHTARVWDTRLVIPTGVVRESHDNGSEIAHPMRVTPQVEPTKRRVLCNLDCQVDCSRMVWTLSEDGWIVHGNDKLIWVPPDLRITLLHPQNSAIIYRRGFLQLNLDCNKLGDCWRENFQPGKYNSL